MQVAIENLTLILWEKREMKDRKKVGDEWVDTGETIEKTFYTLRDEFGDTIKFLSGNEYRDMEGSPVRLTVSFEYNEWQRKNEVKLVDMTQLH